MSYAATTIAYPERYKRYIMRDIPCGRNVDIYHPDQQDRIKAEEDNWELVVINVSNSWALWGELKD